MTGAQLLVWQVDGRPGRFGEPNEEDFLSR